EADVQASLLAGGFRVQTSAIVYEAAGRRHELSYELHWRARPDDVQPPAFLKELAGRADVTRLGWRPQGGQAGPCRGRGAAAGPGVSQGGSAPASGSRIRLTLITSGWARTASSAASGGTESRLTTPIASPPGWARPTFIWAMLTPCAPKVVPMKPI